MNRKERRQYIRNSKALIRQNSHAKGAFGRPPEYIMRDRKEKWLKKAGKYAENLLKNEEKPQDIVVEVKEPTIG